MSKLRSVRTEIAKMRKELEAREAEYRREALAPSMDVLAKLCWMTMNFVLNWNSTVRMKLE